MLISTQTTVALWCSNCGNLGFYKLSRFGFGRDKISRITCKCGACLVTADKKSRAVFYLQIDCMLCERKHLVAYQTAQLWDRSLKTLRCELTGLEIGLIGPTEAVRENIHHVGRSIREITAELGYDSYFLNSDIMNQALDALHIMTEEGRVACECGTKYLEAEIYPDRIELYCTYCEAVHTIFAETDKDLKWLLEMNQLHLGSKTKARITRRRLKRRNYSLRRNT